MATEYREITIKVVVIHGGEEDFIEDFNKLAESHSIDNVNIKEGVVNEMKTCDNCNRLFLATMESCSSCGYVAPSED